jgi:hypothetical protein
MGWAYGTLGDREIGYGVEATCEHPGCTKGIDRGLAYACGGMHGADERSCIRYVCVDHQYPAPDGEGHVCAACAGLDAAGAAAVDDASRRMFLVLDDLIADKVYPFGREP